jgi:hypothetical protein
MNFLNKTKRATRVSIFREYLNLLKCKRSQAELITTVLLILISIAAVVLVSTFVINMVRTNLVGTDCFKTAGQIKINLGEGFTYYDKNGTGTTYVSIARGEETFNLTGLLITVGTGQSSKSYTVRANSTEPSGSVTLYNDKSPELPRVSETRTYKIVNSGEVTTVSVVPYLFPDRLCKEGKDEQQIPSK